MSFHGFSGLLRVALVFILIAASAFSLGAPDDDKPKRLRIAFRSGEGATKLLAKKAASRLGKVLAIDAAARSFPDAEAASEAFAFGHAEALLLEAAACLAARDSAGAEPLAAQIDALGRTSQPVFWLALKGEGPESLAEARGLGAAFGPRGSAWGHVLPLAALVREGLVEPGADPAAFFGKASFLRGGAEALRALLDGSADLAAATDLDLEALSPEERGRVAVVAETGEAPTASLAVHADLSEGFKKKLRAALAEHGEEMGLRPEGPERFAALAEAMELAGLGQEALPAAS